MAQGNQKGVRLSRLLEQHFYHWEKVVIGDGLNAIICAHKTNSHILCNTLVRIFPYDTCSADRTVGRLKLPLYEELAYDLSFKGRHPFVDRIASIRVNLEESILAVTTKNSRTFKIKFNVLRVFDDENVSGLPDGLSEIIQYRVLDWFNVRSGAKHKHDELESASDFVKHIFFYPSDRIDGNHDKKDLVCESYMTKDELYDVNYSDTIVRLKTIDMMKEAGIRGTSNGKNKHLSIRLELREREVIPIKSYKKVEYNNLIFDNRTDEELYKLL
jgi:hypothetical protein